MRDLVVFRAPFRCSAYSKPYLSRAERCANFLRPTRQLEVLDLGNAAHIEQRLPSVPSESVDSFSSNICICPAKPALKSLNCLRFSSSAFFSSMRASNIGDCPDEDPKVPAMEPCRKCEGRGREE